MIKLTLPPKPDELTDELQRQLTEDYKNMGKVVWNRPFIKKAIAAMSFSKCVYSEVRFDEEKYMEVEHFYCKSLYPDKVLEWGNLLGSVKKCNVVKGNLDVAEEPIINPFEVDPREHLYFQKYRYKAREGSEIGKNTITYTAINDWIYFVRKRAKVGNEVSKTLENLEKEMLEIQSDKSTPRRKIIDFCNKIKGLFQQGNRKEEYAALVSTVILEEDETPKLIKFLQQNNLWDSEFKELVTELEFCHLMK